MQFDQKTVLFRNIAQIFSIEKPCYLENYVVKKPCKRRTTCSFFFWISKIERALVWRAFFSSFILVFSGDAPCQQVEEGYRCYSDMKATIFSPYSFFGNHRRIFLVDYRSVANSSVLEVQFVFQTQSYVIKSAPWTILWFRILGIFSVENIKRLCVFMFQTCSNSQLLRRIL